MRSLTIMGFVMALLASAAAQPFRSAQQISPDELFRRGMNAFAGTGRSDSNAVTDIKRSAESGYAPAQTVVGYLYENGIYFAQSQSEAVQWYRKAAKQGDGVAQYSLGRAYYLGLGVQPDKAEAQKWLKSASDQDNPFAQYLLGRLLEDRDYTAAPAEYRKAAEQGIPLAQYRLGLLLKDGRGTAADKSEAYVWLLLSFEAGVKAAEAPLRELEGDLGTTAIETAKSKAREMERSALRSVNAHGCDNWSGEFAEVPTVPPPDTQRFCR